MSEGLNMSCRIRRTPYTDRVEKAGVKGYSVVNHMLLPKAYQHSVEEDYWHLCEHVQIWDVSCQRQVQIKGKDAEKLVQLMTPRKIKDANAGDCLYVPIVDQNGGMVNDPVLLKIDDDCFWLSIADSDLLLYAAGIAIGAEFDVEIDEPDISPLAVQGPKSAEVMADAFGDGIGNLGFFKHKWFEFRGMQLVISRTGYSRQGGFEIYLSDSEMGGLLWDGILESGKMHNIRPGCPNLIERIEGGLLSYGNEMTRNCNPIELGFEKFCTLDGSIEFAGLEALQKVAAEGVKRMIRGVKFEGDRTANCSSPWPVFFGDTRIGQVTSCAWSPRLETNVGLAMIDRGFWNIGQNVEIDNGNGKLWHGMITDLPMN